MSTPARPSRPSRSLLWVPLVLAWSCTDKKPPEVPVDDGRVPAEPQPWEDRWMESFSAYISTGTPAEAYKVCTGLEEATRSTDGTANFSGVPLFTLVATDDGWASRGVDDTPRQKDEPAFVDSPLARYCWIRPLSKAADAFDAEPWDRFLGWAAERSVELSPDLPDTVPLGLGTIAEQTATLVGAEEPLLVGRAFSTPVVRVVVADTEPSGKYAPDSSGQTDHGRATAAIIHSLLCQSSKDQPEDGAPRCGVEIYNEHALPFTLDDTTKRSRVRSSDGAYGTHMSLALAIHRTTERVISDPMPTVLNLSLGWNAGYAQPVDVKALLATKDPKARRAYLQRPTGRLAAASRRFSSLVGGEKAVMEALIRARCMGVVPVVAAGNRTNLPTPERALQDGPLLPAGWMDVVNPTSGDECAQRGYPTGSWVPGEPLVFAVSGVDRQARPVGLGRPNGNAPLAALALGVTVPDASSPGGFHLVSGTSASAGITSAATAAAWAGDTSLDGDAVMKVIYDTGTTAQKVDGTGPVPADFGKASLSSTPAVRIVQLCEAAKATGAVSTCSATSAALGTTGGTSAASRTTTSPTPLTALDCSAEPTTAPCGAQYPPTPDALRNVWPQPPTTSCPPCALELTSGTSSALTGVLTLETAEATAFWRRATWTTRHQLDAMHLELTSNLGVTRIVTYTPGPDLDAFLAGPDQIDVALTDSMNVASAQLVVEARTKSSGVAKSWNVPLPLSKP